MKTDKLSGVVLWSDMLPHSSQRQHHIVGQSEVESLDHFISEGFVQRLSGQRRNQIERAESRIARSLFASPYNLASYPAPRPLRIDEECSYARRFRPRIEQRVNGRFHLIASVKSSAFAPPAAADDSALHLSDEVCAIEYELRVDSEYVNDSGFDLLACVITCAQSARREGDEPLKRRNILYRGLSNQHTVHFFKNRSTPRLQSSVIRAIAFICTPASIAASKLIASM